MDAGLCERHPRQPRKLNKLLRQPRDTIMGPPEDDEIDFSDIPEWTPAQWSRAVRGEEARKILRARSEADRPVWKAFWAAVRPITQTDAFTRWFAASKAVNAEEKPEVLFHATPSSSNDFYCGQGPVGMEYGEDFRTGFYFFSHADTALTYGGPPSQDTRGHSTRVVPVHFQSAGSPHGKGPCGFLGQGRGQGCLVCEDCWGKGCAHSGVGLRFSVGLPVRAMGCLQSRPNQGGHR